MIYEAHCGDNDPSSMNTKCMFMLSLSSSIVLSAIKFTRLQQIQLDWMNRNQTRIFALQWLGIAQQPERQMGRSKSTSGLNLDSKEWTEEHILIQFKCSELFISGLLHVGIRLILAAAAKTWGKGRRLQVLVSYVKFRSKCFEMCWIRF